ncbi:MAG TPA: isoprenyl transferase [Candidatus Marinimicrobia bacterium]|nr:MAG: di-trans,poly-cis-decaprenylcistransferase [Candidatus Marinimicrobia bacterium CG1_02_48_14]PIZ65552.1 MAG: isoprenyl transferase [Candidatus Marinimicrobia bacterium CG_4_10_14_0_2_um_filter_48_9]PJA54852.1 MAG: isoprenyl transferase [Candidatus Marinimicrobia bacterium CG_4_9_14_3_um_filter_48_9]HCW75431.1 isoprenyl transferase [Candidatus Neomarinimicrobiota bacterium]
MNQTIESLKSEILAQGNLPNHIAIIMDGNGRWAKQRGLPRVAGHSEGIKSVRVVTRLCGEMGVKYLTLFTFSSENWQRPRLEVSALMQLLLETINHEVEDLDRNNVRLSVIGRLMDLPEAPRRGMEQAIQRLSKNTGLGLNLALSYGSRQEILDAVNQISQDVADGKIKPGEITADLFSKKLYTANLPDPDLLIRTSGEARISNFLLWQMAYTEMYITPDYWPAFREYELLLAIKDFQKRERRFGKVSEQLIH